MDKESNNTPVSESPTPDQESPESKESEDISNLPLEEQIIALQEARQEAQQEAGQNLDAAQRAQAELANFRRRTDEERISLGKYSNSRLIAKLLPVIEELALAVSHGGGNSGEAPAGEASWETSWLEGVKLVQRKFENLLESEGVAVIESVGTAFNPLEHEAIGTEETTECQPGYVIQAVRQGYRLHDRIIQPAQVIVAREPQDQGSVDNNGEEKESDNG